MCPRPGAQEARRDERLRIAREQFVAGGLLAHEPVAGLVEIETADHVFAAPPGVGALEVVRVASGIGVSHGVEPAPPPAFPVLRRGEQALDNSLSRPPVKGRSQRRRYLPASVEFNRVSLDGVPISRQDVQTPTVTQDAIAEVKVLLTNYQAEYGRLSGANGGKRLRTRHPLEVRARGFLSVKGKNASDTFFAPENAARAPWPTGPVRRRPSPGSTMPLFTTTPARTGKPILAMMLNGVPVRWSVQATPTAASARRWAPRGC